MRKSWKDRRKYHRLQVKVQKPNTSNKESRIAEYIRQIAPLAAGTGATPPVHPRISIAHPGRRT